MRTAGEKYRGLAMFFASNRSVRRDLWDEWEGGRNEFDDCTVLDGE